MRYGFDVSVSLFAGKENNEHTSRNTGGMIGLLLQPLTALLLLIQNPVIGGSSLSEIPSNLRSTRTCSMLNLDDGHGYDL